MDGFKSGSDWSGLFQRITDGETLKDYGPTEPLLGDNVCFPVDRLTVEALADFHFLRRENGSTGAKAFTEFKLAEKARRLLEVLKARESEEKDLVLHRERHFWIVMSNGDVFIDVGITPPNLRALIGEEWHHDDRIVITSHDPQGVRVRDLRRALAVEVYGGLTVQEINEVDQIATDRVPAFRESRT